MFLHKVLAVASSAAFAGICLTSVAVAQENPAPRMLTGADLLAKMVELFKVGENYRILAGLAGTWDYKMDSLDDSSSPTEVSAGTQTIKPTLDGHYFITDLTGKLSMPTGPDGKTTDVDYKGMAIDGYDVVKQKFVSTWSDNMRTSIIMAEGTYDPATKTLTYHYEDEDEWEGGVKTQVRQTLKIIDQDHHVYDTYEMRDGVEVKTSEFTCTRHH